MLVSLLELNKAKILKINLKINEEIINQIKLIIIMVPKYKSQEDKEILKPLN